jgi:hypothetical protein
MTGVVPAKAGTDNHRCVLLHSLRPGSGQSKFGRGDAGQEGLISTLMVRSASLRVSNHETERPSFETRARARSFRMRTGSPVQFDRSTEANRRHSGLFLKFRKFRLPADPNQFTDSPCPVPQRGVAQRHQRGAGCGGRGSAFDEGAEAYGEVVWFRRPDAGVKSAIRSAGDGVKQAWSPGRARSKP